MEAQCTAFSLVFKGLSRISALFMLPSISRKKTYEFGLSCLEKTKKQSMARVEFRLNNKKWSCIGPSIQRGVCKLQERSIGLKHQGQYCNTYFCRTYSKSFGAKVQVCDLIKTGFYLCNWLRKVRCWSLVWEMSEKQTSKEKGTQSCLKFELNSPCWVFDCMNMGDHAVPLHCARDLK